MGYLGKFQSIILYTVIILVISGKSFGTCNAAVGVSPSSFSFGSSGGSGSFTVTTGATGAGTSCHWSLTSSPFISASPTSGGGASTFQFTVNFTAASNPDLGTRTGFITVTQSEDNTKATVTVTEAPATGNFSLAVSPSSQSVIAGGRTSYNITLSRSGGFIGSVCFNAAQLPANSSPSFNPSCTTGNSSTLTVATTGGTPAGSFPFTINGVNGTVTQSVSPTLIVTPGVAKGITTAVNPVANTMDVEYIGTDGHVHQFFYDGIWHAIDLSAVTGAPSASTSGTGIKTIYNSLAASMEIHYIGADQHLYTLWYTGAWHYNDISALTGAPPAALNSSITAAMDPIANSEEVEYIGTDNHVHQLWFDGTWHTQDLTTASGAPANADPSSGINTLMNTIGNSMEVWYIGTDQHIYGQ